MTVFLFFLGLFQCVALYYLGKNGDRLVARAKRAWEEVRHAPHGGWPRCALIIPVSGNNPVMSLALRSLAEQDYPAYELFLVTSSATDPAVALIRELQRQYGNITHVVSGITSGRGQKNHSLLAGVAEAGRAPDIYVFCDSSHIARDDFLKCLVEPIAKGEAGFTTGYHKVDPQDQRIVTLGYAASVLFMHFMQGLPALTQPWGGAMAIAKRAFVHYRVAELWQANVVDDCSLGALLGREGIHVRLCPGAILRTIAAAHPFRIWQAWLERQILFLKFCMKGEWISLSLICALMTIPPIWCAWVCLNGIFDIGGNTAPFLALCWFCVIGWTVGSWRRFLPRRPAITRWLWAFFCSSFMFGLVYAGTLGAKTLIWNRIAYKVGKGGRVEAVKFVDK